MAAGSAAVADAGDRPSASGRRPVASGVGSTGAPSTEIRTTPADRAAESKRDTFEIENPVSTAISG